MGEMVQGIGLAWGGILVACTALNVFAAVLLARLSLPQRLEARLARLRTEVEAFGKALEDFDRKNANNEAVIRGLVEEAESAFDRAERKRSSAAATVSRQQRGNGQEAAPRTRAELIAHMRRTGPSVV